MALANKAQDAMKEKPEKTEGQNVDEEEKDGSDSDQEAKNTNNVENAEELSLSQKVDALFVAADVNQDGKLNLKEAKPMIQKVAAELLGMEDGEAGESLLKNMFEEMDSNSDGMVTKEELLEHLRQLE